MDDRELLNTLFNDWEVALDAAATAQKDVVVIMREHYQDVEDLPPLSMQEAANALWEVAAQKRAALEQFFNDRCK